jgi:F-type H+-transporting ATPase subunit epsilon
MPFRFHVEIVSAEEHIYEGQAKMVSAPAEMGEVGIAPHHAPMLTMLKAGDVRIAEADGDREVSFFVSGGVLEVQPRGVTILSDTVLRAGDIDEREANEARKRAEEALKGNNEKLDYAQAHALLTESLAKLRVVRAMSPDIKE